MAIKLNYILMFHLGSKILVHNNFNKKLKIYCKSKYMLKVTVKLNKYCKCIVFTVN